MEWFDVVISSLATKFQFAAIEVHELVPFANTPQSNLQSALRALEQPMQFGTRYGIRQGVRRTSMENQNYTVFSL